MQSSSSIPIIDCEGHVSYKSSAIIQAIETVGFVYLRDFGIDYKKVTELNKKMMQFWNESEEQKLQFARGSFDHYDHGYVGDNKEHLGELTENVQQLECTQKQKIGTLEVRESFNAHLHCDDQCYPAQTAHQIQSLYKECRILAEDLLYMFSKHLFPQAPETLNNLHRHIGEIENTSLMRLLHYPPLPHIIKAGTERLGEHSDYGTMTLLFQDAIGGLEIRDRNGQFMDATPVENAVLVNLGDMMQRWTNDQWLAVRHRVRVRDDRRSWSDHRQSLVFFVHPDSDAVIQSAKYEPVCAGQFISKKYELTYN